MAGPARYRFDPQQALRDFQDGPDIPRPNLLEQQIPVVGSAWQAVGDLQDGNYGSAAFNGGMAVLEALPVGAAAKGARGAISLAEHVLTLAPKAQTVARAMREANLARAGQQIHHAIPLKGAPRNVPDVRNHPMFLKVLTTAQHRRIHGRWKGEPRFDPIRRIWYGTTAGMKTAPLGLLGYAASSVENATRASPGYAAAADAAAQAPGSNRPRTRR